MPLIKLVGQEFIVYNKYAKRNVVFIDVFESVLTIPGMIEALEDKKTKQKENIEKIRDQINKLEHGLYWAESELCGTQDDLNTLKHIQQKIDQTKVIV